MIKLFSNKKAVHEVITIVLILAIAIVAFAANKNTFTRYTTNFVTDLESNEIQLNQIELKGIIDNELYIVNSLNRKLSIDELKINKSVCDISSSNELNAGINKINISHCISDNLIIDVMITFNNQIISQMMPIRNNLKKK